MPSDDRTLIQPDLCPRAGDAEVPSGLPAETRIQPDQDQAPGDEVLSGAHRGTSVRGTSDAAQVELDDSGPGMTPRLSGEAEDQARQRSLGVPQVPDYDVKTLLGKGAFGEVWLAVEVAHWEAGGHQVLLPRYRRAMGIAPGRGETARPSQLRPRDRTAH